ncbi:methyltransferase domain-containing protein [Psychromarinibacter sp. C21-152]|uniref:Methyltransferase domain-containing protein n=1 Tax=Psychromarinibacter sediminicola TaxID=3033385 RepID=A0AAE3NU32_9RHOB|nr:methyltransferase domain-containing protein [Psychromarinibacter sediminicola]MDF0602067.1 methyltransferase domain-containing protein [Psychromarinibacter sediminicola]
MTEGITFADRYQSVLVPVIFEPWARELIGRADIQAGDHILDLACGTGVVTREVAKRTPSFGSLTAVDHSAEMLRVARSLVDEPGLNVEWVEADAAALPLADNRFDLAFCQQALQFFPDKLAALRELRRVLKPGGRAVFCVQKGLDVNPMLKAQAEALEAHVGADAAAAVRAICSLADGAEIQQLFEQAGFRTIDVTSVTLDLTHPDAMVFATGAMGGMHTGDKLSGLADEAVDGAVEAFLAGLGNCLDGRCLHFPHVSNVVVATA